MKNNEWGRGAGWFLRHSLFLIRCGISASLYPRNLPNIPRIADTISGGRSSKLQFVSPTRTSSVNVLARNSGVAAGSPRYHQPAGNTSAT